MQVYLYVMWLCQVSLSFLRSSGVSCSKKRATCGDLNDCTSRCRDLLNLHMFPIFPLNTYSGTRSAQDLLSASIDLLPHPSTTYERHLTIGRSKSRFRMSRNIDSLVTPNRQAPESANSRIHLQTLNVRIPLDRFSLASNNHPKRSISNNDEAEGHRNKPVKGNEVPAGFKYQLDTGSVNYEGSKR